MTLCTLIRYQHTGEILEAFSVNKIVNVSLDRSIDYEISVKTVLSRSSEVNIGSNGTVRAVNTEHGGVNIGFVGANGGVNIGIVGANIGNAVSIKETLGLLARRVHFILPVTVVRTYM